ncbi:MAG: cytochrome c biogenesis protein CcsA [Bacteroidales bacterium]|nr:cytochrome c biogenesis protein CcsA [Bacteroidales bacterium]
MKKLLNIRFILLLLIIVSLAVATFVEVNHGTEFVMLRFYHAVWFMVLLGVTALLFLIDTIHKKSYRHNKPYFWATIAMIVILAGGLCSTLTAERGVLSLRKSGTAHEIEVAQGTIRLPFSVTLQNFKILYYEGTITHSGYESEVVFKDKQRQLTKKVTVNHPVTFHGYRFYQTSYDSDGNGTLFSVVYDPIGTSLTYCGYALLIFSMIGYFVKKIRRKRTRVISLMLLLIAFSGTLSAQKTITKEEATAFGQILIQYNGRIVPLSTYATDFTLKLIGKSSYKEFNAEQVLAGWLFYPEIWQYEKMVKHKGIKEFDEKFAIIMQLHDGYSLKIFPYKNAWYAPTDNLKAINSEDTLFIAHILQYLYESVDQEDHAGTMAILSKIKLYQLSRTEELTILNSKIEAEIFLNHLPFIAITFPVLLTLALFSFILLIINNFYQNKLKIFFTISKLLTLLVFIALTIFILLRTYISAHFPFSNGYETMLLLSWILMLMTLIFAYKSNFLLFGGQLLTGFTLLVCSLNAMNPQITTLMPVLHSPWLSIHVSLMMISYALLAFIAMIGLLFLISKGFAENEQEFLESLTKTSKTLFYPAIALMVTGIIAGSIWANVSWGRYWGWDPKEVWALITTLIYSFYLFESDLHFFKKEHYYHLFMLIAFSFVLMTYFGVNIFFAGLHSYGG